MIDISNLLYSLASMISGLDFNPTGEYVATMDRMYGCLVSDVTTVNYEFHQGLGRNGGIFDSEEFFFLLHEK